jgi:hypothetical protein
LNSSGKENYFSQSCTMCHKYTVNKDGHACFDFWSPAGHHAPQRMK